MNVKYTRDDLYEMTLKLIELDLRDSFKRNSGDAPHPDYLREIAMRTLNAPENGRDKNRNTLATFNAHRVFWLIESLGYVRGPHAKPGEVYQEPQYQTYSILDPGRRR